MVEVSQRLHLIWVTLLYLILILFFQPSSGCNVDELVAYKAQLCIPHGQNTDVYLNYLSISLSFKISDRFDDYIVNRRGSTQMVNM